MVKSISLRGKRSENKDKSKEVKTAKTQAKKACALPIIPVKLREGKAKEGTMTIILLGQLVALERTGRIVPVLRVVPELVPM